MFFYPQIAIDLRYWVIWGHEGSNTNQGQQQSRLIAPIKAPIRLELGKNYELYFDENFFLAFRPS